MLWRLHLTAPASGVPCLRLFQFPAYIPVSYTHLDVYKRQELYHCAVRFLDIYNALHIFRCQRLKIQLVCNIKICAHRFRVIIYNDRFIAFFGKCPCTMHGTKVELDSLTDPYRARTCLLYTSIFLFHYMDVSAVTVTYSHPV